jgi:hypothetical protein
MADGQKQQQKAQSRQDGPQDIAHGRVERSAQVQVFVMVS